MSGRIIQGFFVNGRGRPLPATVQRAQPVGAVNARPMPGPPPPAFAGRALTAQAKPAPGRPPLVHQTAQVAQPFGGADSFEIDPAQVGLARGGGRPLPQAVLAKMEAAFGADFSTVRVHEGPQAPRIGAVAFTMGDDLYFAPGRFQPESVQGQQLIGHELAHVIQQRQGRVRAPGSGVAVVQDRALEAEADRMGMRAAQQIKSSDRPGPSRFPGATAQRFRAAPSALGRRAVQPATSSASGMISGHSTIQRMTQIIYTQTNYRPATDTIHNFSHKRTIHNQTHRNIVAHLCGWASYGDAGANGCLICNHYVSYSTIATAVADHLEAGPATLGAAVAWLNGLVLLPAQIAQVQVGNNLWNQPLGMQPGINILPHHNIHGVNYYDEEEVASEIDDLIYNLANDPRNMFYWPNSTGQNAAGIDTPIGALPHTNLAAITGRLTGYRAFLQGLGLNV